MLRRIGTKYAVESDEAFKIDRIGSPLTQFIMRYHQGATILEYRLENIVTGAPFPIEVQYIREWNAPHEKEKIPPEMRLHIAERICAAILFLGDRAYVVR